MCYLLIRGGDFMDIYIDTAQVRSIVKQMRQYSSNLNDIVVQLTSIIDNIENAWQGSDATIYVERLRSKCITDIKILNKLLEQYENYLSNVPGAYETLDNVFQTKRINV